MSGKGQTVKAKTPVAKPKAPGYTMVIDETGAMKRVPIAAVTTSKPTTTPAVTSVRPSITTTAIQQTASKPLTVAVKEENDELIFDAPVEEENDELVFNATGEVTGEAKKKAQQEAKAKAEAEAKKNAAPGPSVTGPSARKPSKAEKTMGDALSDVEKMRLFYRYRSKNPVYFQYTAEGNLEVKENNPLKIPPMVIPMRAFGPLKPEELEEVERKQKEVQEEIEQEYVVKLKELRLTNDAYNPEIPETVAAVVKANEALREISVLRNRALYPERWTEELESVDIRHILLNQPYEDRKLGYPVYLFKRYSLARQDVEGHYREHGEAFGEQEGGGTVVLFITSLDDQKTGIFHPATEHDFVYNETKYSSPYQAFEVERFKQLEEDGMVEKLLGTRSAKTIKNIVEKEPRQVQHPLKLWEEILEALCSQRKNVGDALKETGSARFHMMDKVIGTPEYSMALANVRTKLKEKENDAPDNIGDIKQSVITKEQQEKDKVGAIVNNFRRGKNF